MDTEQGVYSGYRHINMALNGEVARRFKQLLAMENSTPNKMIGHFMANYTNYLDASFLENAAKKRRNRGSAYFTFDVPSGVFSAFCAKIEKEGLKISSAVAEMIENYVRFASKAYENDES